MMLITMIVKLWLKVHLDAPHPVDRSRLGIPQMMFTRVQVPVKVVGIGEGVLADQIAAKVDQPDDLASYQSLDN